MFGYKAFLTTSPASKLLAHKDTAITTHHSMLIFSKNITQASESRCNCDFTEHLQRDWDRHRQLDPKNFSGHLIFSRTSLIRQRSKVDWSENCVTLFAKSNGNRRSNSKSATSICKLPIIYSKFVRYHNTGAGSWCPVARSQVHIWRLSNGRGPISRPLGWWLVSNGYKQFVRLSTCYSYVNTRTNCFHFTQASGQQRSLWGLGGPRISFWRFH